jgi:hypothetical protein
MRKLLLFIFPLLSQAILAQYKVDSTLKKEYLKLFERFQGKMKRETDNEFQKGLGILYKEKTDTLNKNDLEQGDHSIEIYDINSETGKVDSLAKSPTEEEMVSENQPFPLSCSCIFKNDTLIITSSIYLFSGFAVTTKLYHGKAKAFYTEVESEGKVFRRTLNEEKVNAIKIPAVINVLTLDRYLRNDINELYGNIAVTTNAYYSYVNTWGFKNGYIYKRMKIQFYFKCITTK